MARNKKQPKGISFKDNFSTVNSSCLHIFLRLVILGILLIYFSGVRDKGISYMTKREIMLFWKDYWNCLKKLSPKFEKIWGFTTVKHFENQSTFFKCSIGFIETLYKLLKLKNVDIHLFIYLFIYYFLVDAVLDKYM